KLVVHLRSELELESWARSLDVASIVPILRRNHIRKADIVGGLIGPSDLLQAGLTDMSILRRIYGLCLSSSSVATTPRPLRPGTVLLPFQKEILELGLDP